LFVSETNTEKIQEIPLSASVSESKALPTPTSLKELLAFDPKKTGGKKNPNPHFLREPQLKFEGTWPSILSN